MISKSLWNSKKFAGLVAEHGPWAGLVYIAQVTGTDVDGRLEAGAEDLADLLGRTARLSGRTPGGLREDSRACEDSGLITRWNDDSGEYAEVIDFKLHNKTRPDREAPSRITPGVLREDSGSTPPQVQGEVQVQEEVEVQGKWKGEGHRPTTGYADEDSEYRRILRCLHAVFERSGILDWGPKPREDIAIREAARLGTCRRWAGDDELAAELQRTHEGAIARGLGSPDGAFLLNHVGESWEERKRNGEEPPDPYRFGINPEDLRAEYDAIEEENRRSRAARQAERAAAEGGGS